jgi:hypothetical protein
MVTDMAWADVNGNGKLDMVIVGDWMPVKVFVNEQGRFTDQSAAYGLEGTEGWWNVILAKDLNGDGRADFILGNHGLNSRFQASGEKPVTMYVNDFDMNGSVEQIICTYKGERSYPLVMKDDLVGQIPSLERDYPTFASYSGKTMEDLFSEEILKRSVVLQAHMLESCVLMNRGSGSFHLEVLPVEAQFAPVYAITARDFNQDGWTDLVLGGNQHRAKPETGIYTASFGIYLQAEPSGNWVSQPALQSGICTRGEIREFRFLEVKQDTVMVVVRNNDILEFYNYD